MFCSRDYDKIFTVLIQKHIIRKIINVITPLYPTLSVGQGCSRQHYR